MPDFNQSPALLEARAVAPRNIREIETVEIRQADVLFSKRTLEVCFIIDTFAKLYTNYVTWSNSYSAPNGWFTGSNAGSTPTVVGDLLTFYNNVSVGADYAILRKYAEGMPAGQVTLQAELKAGTLNKVYLNPFSDGVWGQVECNLTNEWQLFSVTVTNSGTPGNYLFDIGSNAGIGQVNGAGSVHVRNVQITAGSAPRVFIPTTAAPASASTFTPIIESLKQAANGINSDLREKYVRVKYALVAVTPIARAFATGPGFTTYRKFRQALEAVEISLDENLVDSYGAVTEAVERLNWAPEGASIDQHIVLLTDSTNGTLVSGGSIPRVVFTTSCISVTYGTGDVVYWTLSCEDFPDFADGELVVVEGFTNPSNNGMFRIGTVYGASMTFLNPDGTPATVFAETPGTVTITTVDTIDGDIDTTPGGDPSGAIAALGDTSIQLNWGPSFADVGLASLVTATDGVTFTGEEVSTKALSRAFFVELLSSSAGVIEGLDPIYLVNDNKPLTANLENGDLISFERRNFGLNVYGSGEDGMRNMTLTVDNTDKAVSRYVAEAKKRSAPLEITFRVYLSNDLTGPQNAVPIKLYMVDVETRGTLVSGEAKWIDIINAPFPNTYYLPANFPSL